MNRLLQIFRRHETCISLCLANVIMCLWPFLVTVTFDAHDDVQMLLLASGAYTGTPETHLIYNHIFYGAFLAKLYTWCQSVEWYTVVQYALQMVSINVFLYHILHLACRSALRRLYMWTLVCAGLLLLMRPQYTFVGSELALASLVLIFRKTSRPRYLLAFALFFAACLLRTTSACIPYLICGALLVFPMRWREVAYRVRLGFLFVLLFTAGVLHFIDQRAYASHAAWAHYVEFNTARQYLGDNPSREAYSSQIADPAKAAAYSLFCSAGLPEPEVLTTHDLTEAVAHVKPYSLRNVVHNLRPFLRDYLQTGLFLVCTLLFLVALCTPRRRDWPLWLCFLAFLAANFYCMTRSTSKVYLSMALTLPFLFAVAQNVYEKGLRRWHLDVVIPLVAIAWFGYRMDYTQKWNARYFADFSDARTLCERTDAPKVFYFMGLAGENAFAYSHSVQGKKFYWPSWPAASPYNLQFMPNYAGLADGMPVLVTEQRKHHVEKIQHILLAHYHIPTEICVLDHSGKFLLLQLRRLPE